MASTSERKRELRKGIYTRMQAAVSHAVEVGDAKSLGVLVMQMVQQVCAPMTRQQLELWFRTLDKKYGHMVSETEERGE